ncbi:unnamed protein product [Somion occarium]|uniref:Uncharacterized protein n=1 Tax=Somion occarium TaxID=3059160 RepID=A0ABP1E8P3_9APHY
MAKVPHPIASGRSRLSRMTSCLHAVKCTSRSHTRVFLLLVDVLLTHHDGATCWQEKRCRHVPSSTKVIIVCSSTDEPLHNTRQFQLQYLRLVCLCRECLRFFFARGILRIKHRLMLWVCFDLMPFRILFRRKCYHEVSQVSLPVLDLRSPPKKSLTSTILTEMPVVCESSHVIQVTGKVQKLRICQGQDTKHRVLQKMYDIYSALHRVSDVLYNDRCVACEDARRYGHAGTLLSFSEPQRSDESSQQLATEERRSSKVESLPDQNKKHARSFMVKGNPSTLARFRSIAVTVIRIPFFL